MSSPRRRPEVRQHRKPGRQRVGIAWATGMPGFPAVAGPGSPGSFTRLVPAWLADLAMKNYAEASCKTWSTALGLFAAWCAERDIFDAPQVTRAVVEAYQRHVFYMRTGYGRGPHGATPTPAAQPLANRTQRGRLHAVDRFYAWAVRRGLVPANPAADLELPRKTKPLPEYLTPEEAAAVFGACDVSDPRGLRDRAFLEVLYSTGLRRAEALTLMLDDIDHARGTVRVLHGKGAKDRYSPIGQRALDWLARYDQEARSRWCVDAGEHHVFLDVDGRPVSSTRIGGRIFRLMREAGIMKRGACHLFRHGFATGLVEAGCDIRLIAAMLGHSDLDSTMLYTRVGIGKLVAAHKLYHPAERPAAAKEAASGDASGSAGVVAEAAPTRADAPSGAAHPVRGSPEDAPPS